MTDDRTNRQEEPEQELGEVLRLRREKLAELERDGRSPYLQKRYDRTHYSARIKADFEAHENKTVSVAGRIMSKRLMGKAAFFDIQDMEGRIQIYVRQDDIGESEYAGFKKWDIGDIVGVEGKVFKTRHGEISVHTEKIVLLSKSLLPLPEKWHGLTNTDLRYRQRYVDLIVNPDVRDTFYKRSRILKEIRAFLDARGYLEVDTPVLHTLETGAAARPFKTHHNTLDLDMYLRIELELHLKRLIVGGLEKVYEVGRIFRNEGMSPKHNPEFTMIELYEAYIDYRQVMELVEQLYEHVALAVCGTTEITYQGTPISLKTPWERLTMAQSVEKYCGVRFDDWADDAAARKAADAHGVYVKPDATRGDVLIAFFDEKVEEHLIQPVFICDYPVENSPLAKRKTDNPAFTERFEFFIYAREMGNAFTELNDPIDQRARFERQCAIRRAEGVTDARVDEDYINALEYGLPPTGGLGFGFDRLVMLLTDNPSIRDVLLFPTMKPVGETQSEEDAHVDEV